MIFISDHENPVIYDLLPSIIKETDKSLATAIVYWTEPSAEDNSGVYTLTTSHPPGSSFSMGNTTVVYLCTDAFGNSVSEMLIVTVQGTYHVEIFFLNNIIRVY